MGTQVRGYRAAVVLLSAALVTTVMLLATGPERAAAVEGPVDVVYVASGRNFPDALAGATLAATTGAPLLTVEPGLPLPATTVAALRSLDPDRIVVLGGPVAVSEAVRGALADLARSGSVIRIQGPDRHATAALIADALPAKVHDSDQLDGLDSDAFLRTGATAADAEMLDGLDSDAFLRTGATAADAEMLDGQPATSYRVYHLTINTLTVQANGTSPELVDTIVFRRSGQPTGHFCVDLPDDGAFSARGVVGSPSTNVATGLTGPTDLVVLASLNDGCISDGADLSVRLGNNGTLVDGRYVLLVPGA